MRKLLFLVLLISSCAKAQSDSTFVDKKYLEDQIYLNLTYIALLNTPPPISQSGFSFGLGGGFIKDLPVNSRRNIGFGAGLGYGFNNYYFNVRFEYEEPSEDNAPLNSKIMLHVVELPLELRFRTSTATRYKFWRFYPGFKISYVFAENLSLGKDADFDVEGVAQYNDFLYGLTFSGGYNKWNIHLYYGLNDLITNTEENDYEFAITDFRIGLVFYVF
ncbi:MAG: porin family protein [Lutimonas sp.]